MAESRCKLVVVQSMIMARKKKQGQEIVDGNPPVRILRTGGLLRLQNCQHGL